MALWYLKNYPTLRSAKAHWRKLGYAFHYDHVWAVIGVLGAASKRYFDLVTPLIYNDLHNVRRCTPAASCALS